MRPGEGLSANGLNPENLNRDCSTLIKKLRDPIVIQAKWQNPSHKNPKHFKEAPTG